MPWLNHPSFVIFKYIYLQTLKGKLIQSSVCLRFFFFFFNATEVLVYAVVLVQFSNLHFVFPVPLLHPLQVLRKMSFKPFVSWLNTLTFFSQIYMNTHMPHTHKINIVYLFFISRNGAIWTQYQPLLISILSFSSLKDYFFPLIICEEQAYW